MAAGAGPRSGGAADYPVDAGPAKIAIVASFHGAPWYSVRPAASRKPATYRCPFCGELLPALVAHMLVLPQNDAARRRHAHSACVMRARDAGRLPLIEDFRPHRPGLVARLLRRG